MGDDPRAKLGDYRRSRAQRCYEQEDFAEALRWLGSPVSAPEKALASTCHYKLMKAATARGQVEAARAHAKEVLRINVAPRGMRHLVDQRLRLLRRGTQAVPALAEGLRLGMATVPRLGDVIVLGEHGTRGRPRDLAPIIELLKKAPEELDSDELDARPRIIELIGAVLALALRRAGIAQRIDLIAPIPVDPERFRTRRYSPQEQIADALAVHAMVPCVADLLIKTRETRAVRGLSPDEREVELSGSMAASDRWRHLLDKVTVLLVDDVVTYGTHFREAGRVLKDAGAVEVLGCAVATGRANFRPVPTLP